MEIQERNEIFIKKTKESFYFLHDYGYKLIEIKEKKIDTFFPNSVTVSYQNERLRLHLDIHYSPIFTSISPETKKDDYELNSISVAFIKNLYEKEGMMVMDGGNYLSFYRYLKKHHISNFNDNIFKINNYEGSFEERVDKVLIAYVDYLKEYAQGLLTGKEWVKDCDIMSDYR